MKYSIVVPVYNEEGNVEELHKRIKQTMESLGEPYEIIFIDDGSFDGTATKMKALSPLTVITFRKNFGQTAAMDAGFKLAQGEFIITLDGDLQNPPEEIPKLIAKQKEGFDVVSGWRKDRKDPFFKHLVSRGANRLRKVFIDEGIHDSGCTLKIYRKECFDNLNLHGEIHRFIPGVLKWQGFTIGEVAVEHAPRKSGETKYTYARILKGFVDMIGVWFWRKYSSRPLHLFGGTGIIFTLLGSALLVALFILRLFKIISLADSIWPLVAIFLILVGILLFVSGLLAEIMVKNFYTDGRTPYNIKKVTKN
ncbi:glycosyltransferase family 2 protein [Patescibacteria group bacterium]|nr:glycosyltransferase family 2 protein [Patescibacteria group bacterium]